MGDVQRTKLLIVDGDPRMRSMIRELLADRAFEIFEGEDGGEALRLYRVHRPDWVVLDMEMAPMDGISAARSIREEDPRSRMVMLSKFDSRQFRRAAAATGVQAYLLKDHLKDLPALLTSLSEAPIHHSQPDLLP